MSRGLEQGCFQCDDRWESPQVSSAQWVGGHAVAQSPPLCPQHQRFCLQWTKQHVTACKHQLNAIFSLIPSRKGHWTCPLTVQLLKSRWEKLWVDQNVKLMTFYASDFVCNISFLLEIVCSLSGTLQTTQGWKKSFNLFSCFIYR